MIYLLVSSNSRCPIDSGEAALRRRKKDLGLRGCTLPYVTVEQTARWSPQRPEQLFYTCLCPSICSHKLGICVNKESCDIIMSTSASKILPPHNPVLVPWWLFLKWCSNKKLRSHFVKRTSRPSSSGLHTAGGTCLDNILVGKSNYL